MSFVQRGFGTLFAYFLAAIAAAMGPMTARGSTPFGTSVAVSYSPDGNLIAVADVARKLAILRADGGHEPGFALRELSDSIIAIQFSADGRQVLVITTAGLHAIDVASGADTVKAEISAFAAAFSPDGRRVAIPAGDNVVVLDTGTGKQVASFPTGLGLPQTLSFSPDGTLLAVGAQETIMTLGAEPPHGIANRSVELFQLASGRKRTYKSASPWISAIGISADGATITAISFDHTAGRAVNDYKNTTVNVWDVASGRSILEEPLPDDTSFYSFLAYLPHTTTILATARASFGGDIALIDSASGRITHSKPYDVQPIFGAAMAPSATVIAIGGLFKGVQMRDLPSRTLAATLEVVDPASAGAP